MPVPGYDGDAMNEGRGRDQTIFERHGPAAGAELGEKARPAQAHGRFPSKTVDALDPILEPALQSLAAFPDRQQKNPKADFAQDHGIHGDLPLMTRQPFQHSTIGRGPGGFAENVGVNQEGHRVSVDSDSMGTKNPFSGQARSQSRRP